MTILDAQQPAAPSIAELQATWDVEVFFDGACPLCRSEIDMLRRRDRQKRIRFTDISADCFDPQAYSRTLQDFMSEIQGRLPDGTWLTGVEVFRRLYAATGFSWLVAFTRLPGVSGLCEAGYRIFARNRLKLTGRCSSADACRLG